MSGVNLKPRNVAASEELVSVFARDRGIRTLQWLPRQPNTVRRRRSAHSFTSLSPRMWVSGTEQHMECFEDESKELPRPDLHATAPVKGCYPDLAAHDLAELELKNISTGGGQPAPVGHAI